MIQQVTGITEGITITKIEQLVVSWLGLDKAGKTTLLRKVTTGEFQEKSYPTLGMTTDEFTFEDIIFYGFDLGGQKQYRSTLWAKHIKESVGIIYVVDSSDFDRFEETKRELWFYILSNEKANIPLLILANKQDLVPKMTAGELARKLELYKVTDRSFGIFPVSAKSGFNINTAMDWIANTLHEIKPELDFWAEI